MADRSDVAAVVLAAGLGTRFRSDLAKVMHRVAGRTMLRHVLDALRPLGVGQVVVVVGHQAEDVEAEAAGAGVPGTVSVLQEEQLGTGHAAAQALRVLDDDVERLLVLPGDAPLLTSATLADLVSAAGDGTDAVLATMELDDPTGYGRILRDDTGALVGIVEEADATDAQRGLREVNAGAYVFGRDALAAAVGKLDTDNAQGEQYLTDVVGILVDEGRTVRPVITPADELAGVNDRAQLADAGEILRRRTLDRLMRDGVTIVDPAATYIDVGVEIGRDTTILPGCLVSGDTRIGSGAVIGPYTQMEDATAGDGARVEQSVVRGAEIGPGVNVGPFAYLRPGTRLERGAKAGTFVELKNTSVGEGAKVPHLSYVGDATIGRDVNVGAGSITCNYDGVNKHETEIGDGAFIGSDTMLVAPVRIGRGAYTAAGSTITRDVPDDALGIERSEQANKEGWAARRRDERDRP